MVSEANNFIRRHSVLIAFAVFVLWVVATRWMLRHEPMERDISTYAVVGRELLAGRPLYSDLWDHKPPGVHLIFAGATAVVGPGVPAVLLVNVALSIAVIGTMMGGAYRVGGARCAVVCGGMWAAVGIDLGLQANQPNVELAMNLCISLALAASLAATPQDKGRGAGPIGVLTAFAVLLKPVAAAQFGLLAAVEIGERWRNRQKGESARYFGRWVGAAVAILVIVMSWCVFRAGFDPVWDAVIRYNLSYAKGSLLDNLVEVPRFWLYLPLTSVAVIVLLSMATIRGLVVVGAPVRHRILAVLTGAVTAIAAPGRFYPHYYQLLLVPLVLAAAAGLSEGLKRG